MTKEQLPQSEPMTPAERGRATFQLQQDFFSGLRNCRPYIDALHKWVTGDNYPTAFGNPRGSVRFTLGEASYGVQIGTHYTDQITSETPDVMKILKIDIIEPGDHKFGHIRRNRHTTISASSEYKVDKSDGSIVTHLDGKLKKVVNHQTVELYAGNSETYTDLRRILAPILNLRDTRADNLHDDDVVSKPDSRFIYFSEELPTD